MKNIFFLFLLNLGSLAFGQAPKGFIDIERSQKNVRLVLSYDNPSIQQLDTLIQLGRNYTQTNKDTALLLIDKAVELSKNSNHKRQYGRALSSKGAALSRFGFGSESVESMREAKEVFREIDHKIGIASVDRFLGAHYLQLGRLQTSVKHYLNSLELYKSSIKDSRALIGPLKGLSDVYLKLGEYGKAQKYLSEALEIVDSTDVVYLESEFRNDQARLYSEIGQSLIFKADTMSSKSSDIRDSSRLFFKMGLKESDKALFAAKRIDDLSYIVGSLITQAQLRNQIEDYPRAKELAEDAMELSIKLEDPLELVNSRLNLAQALIGLKDFNGAFSPLSKALLETEAEGFEYEKLKALDLFLKLYVAKGQSKEALVILEKRNLHAKRLNSISTQKAIADAETKYQTAEKETQILKQENSILELESSNSKIEKQRNYIISGSILLGLLCLFAFRLNRIKRDRNDKRIFVEALISAQEEERKRIARGLHDGVGQDLLFVKKQLEKSENSTDESQEMISQTIEEIRRISRDLHPFQLEKFGLTSSILNIIDRIEHSTDLFASKEIENIDNILPVHAETHLFRTIQEALSNIIKHANATAIKLIVEDSSNEIKVKIQDNGKGFNLDEITVSSRNLGIKTMQERISAIGGQLFITKGPTSGMEINIKVPKT